MKRPPPFWAQRTQIAHSPAGAEFLMSVWGWSHRSRDEAERKAAERIESLMAQGGPGHVPADWYYPSTPLREPVLDSIGEDPEPLAIVTRNRYGAKVLNTDAVVIADVDTPDVRRRSRGLFGRLFGAPTEPDPADAARERIVAFAEAHPDLGVRSYRTPAGFRVFITSSGASPGDEHATALLEELGSDPLYVRLCRAQRSFRARLSPKPWRLDMSVPSVRWPASRPDDERIAAAWVAEYEARSTSCAACTLEASFGPAPSADEQRVIDLHDREAGAGSGLPLA